MFLYGILIRSYIQTHIYYPPGVLNCCVGCKQPRSVVNSHYVQKQADAFNPGHQGMCRDPAGNLELAEGKGMCSMALLLGCQHTYWGSEFGFFLPSHLPLPLSPILLPASFMRIYEAFPQFDSSYYFTHLNTLLHRPHRKHTAHHKVIKNY